MSPDEEWVMIAKVGAPHGVSGEVKIFSLSDVSGRFENLRCVHWIGKQKKAQRLTVVSSRPCERFIILRFQEIQDRNQAAGLTNGWLALPKVQRGTLSPDNYFIDDIIGLTVEDQQGRVLGNVVDVYQTGSNDVYEIRGSGKKEMMLPARKEIILKIDLEQKKMIVKIPEGY
ncbi:ribosome maturation factor RimM [bacterium]|nr:ribosome maturation factor RimM [bacterium]